MNTQRLDIYRSIHKGLRAFLSDTLLTVGRMDFLSDSDLETGLSMLNGLLAFCEKHLQHENEFVHPAMEACAPGSAEDMNEHHQQHVAMILELRGMSERLHAASLSLREAQAALLYRKLALFVADNLAHMHEEETRNNEILWNGYSDEYIMEIHDAILRAIPAEENAIGMRWMLSAFNHQERQQMLEGMKKQAPREVFELTLGLARDTLPVGEWNKLQFAVGA